MHNLQNSKVIAIDSKLDNGDIIAGLVIVDARTSSPQTIVDIDNGLRYQVQLPEELESQGVTASLENCKLMVLGFD